ncbi:MAG: protein kinase [Acidobacteria bacterium]|nr:protein kinase [Acidobacteriota bacterium]MCA1642388.1 protein kinase [Acidobacteriota bacterium]
MTLTTGTRLGRYEVRSKIGEGGMGEVYLAHDTRLGRAVALKVLPADVARDERRMQRFVQEARAASALNHPNIITIHEIEDEGAVNFIATEFIDGETLRARMNRGGLRLGESVEIAAQIVSALSAAHAAGIVHRDVKPENVMIRRDGYVKVLDFGLAKLTGLPSGSIDTEAATRALVNTDPGAVMGTVAYMSPEQARGKEVDARTDLFSLGVVLYEMIAGRVPFAGETVSHVIVSILEREPPPPSALARHVPEALDLFVAQALAKDPEERWQTAKQMLAALKKIRQRLASEAEIERSTAPELLSRTIASSSGGTASSGVAGATASAGEGGSGAQATLAAAPADTARSVAGATNASAAPAPRLKGWQKALGAAGALIIFAGPFVSLLRSYLEPDKPARRVVQPVGARANEAQTAQSSGSVKLTRLTSTGKVKHAAISPDGKYAVHVVDEAGRQGLWIRQIATASNVNVLPPVEADYLGLTFSQDGNYVYYVRREKAGDKGFVYQMPALGGSSRKITEGADGPITLSPDGRRLAFVRYDYTRGESALIVADMDGGSERSLATRKEPAGLSTEGTAWSPDGKVIVCAAYSASTDDAVTLVEVAVEDGRERQILPMQMGAIDNIAWLADGSGLLMAAADKSSGYFYQIWHVAYPDGEARRITNDLNNYSDVSVTADSDTLLTVQSDAISNLWVAPSVDSSRARRITSGKHDGNMGVAWTPDGRIVHASRDWDISILDADGSNQKLLTIDEHNNRWVSVTPDGRYILFESWRKGASSGVWRMDIDGGDPKPIAVRGWASVPKSSPDAKWVVYESNVSGKTTLWKTSIDGGEATQLTDRITADPAISPDGKLIACFYYPGRSVKLAVIPFAGGEPLFEFDVDGGIRDKTPGWTADGRAITYVLNRGGVSNIWSQPLNGGAPKQLTDFKTDLIFAYDLSRDGKQLVLARGTISNDVVLISDFRR